MRNMNQGEFYIYNLDGGRRGLDTIKVNEGRLAYEIPCDKPAILVMVFPNFSEQPIFAEPGASVELKADASHLKLLEVTGTEDNKLMNRFRKQAADASPVDVLKYAEQFVKDHPKSAVSEYLIRRYFITGDRTDYKKALQLIKIMKAASPKDASLGELERELKPLADNRIGSVVPKFTAVDINGKRVDNSSLRSEVAVIATWASWSYDSQNLQRKLRDIERRSKGHLKVVSICVDPYVKTCRTMVERDSLTAWPTICDEQMLASPLIQKLGLYAVPSTIIIEDGRITGRNLLTNDIQRELTERLKYFK